MTNFSFLGIMLISEDLQRFHVFLEVFPFQFFECINYKFPLAEINKNIALLGLLAILTAGITSIITFDFERITVLFCEHFRYISIIPLLHSKASQTPTANE